MEAQWREIITSVTEREGEKKVKHKQKTEKKFKWNIRTEYFGEK